MKKNQIQKTKKRSKQSYEFYFDYISEKMVFEIHDTEGMLPLLIKGPFEKIYELVHTGNNKLNIR